MNVIDTLAAWPGPKEIGRETSIDKRAPIKKLCATLSQKEI